MNISIKRNKAKFAGGASAGSWDFIAGNAGAAGLCGEIGGLREFDVLALAVGIRRGAFPRRSFRPAGSNRDAQ
jgi:hypothetical protein